MQRFKPFLFFLIIPLIAFTNIHKYYISVTQIEYVKEEKSIQIISRIFIDDLENVLRKRYNDSIIIDDPQYVKETNKYIEKYLRNKIKIKVNGAETNFNFVGKEYNLDIVKCYLEIKNIENITSFEISNKVLFDMFDDQQNIIKTNINSKQKSFILVSQNDTVVLNFN
ncbi:peptidase E [Seonamhaeicola sp. S2-3]|uniref:DUF6702 family protein n=1 Tax=Seonamhaeicola sp. S2-3 TaxID=1936081 RepID=UPI000972995A|nr:DUF6702 family protein [Seonamhaeicola sp. S2-3]APY12054.1 peptidase E [Seonamhaeicola sp. S2-3]